MRYILKPKCKRDIAAWRAYKRSCIRRYWDNITFHIFIGANSKFKGK